MELPNNITMTNTNTAQSYNKYLQMRIDSFNNTTGNLTGYDCHICKNKGQILKLVDDCEILCECECIAKRNTLRKIERSGLKDLLKSYTFDTYKDTEQWQKACKSTAINFVNNHSGMWFFAGGQVGGGKTHLCTAIVGEFIKKGYDAHYMLWRDEATSLKAKIKDGEAYEKAIKKIKDVKVLYIDDFLKTEQGKQPTQADINLAFEILNYRYNNPELITLISSEKLISEIINIDEAVGSRIYQKSITHCLNLGKDKAKNYRLRR